MSNTNGFKGMSADEVSGSFKKQREAFRKSTSELFCAFRRELRKKDRRIEGLVRENAVLRQKLGLDPNLPLIKFNYPNHQRPLDLAKLTVDSILPLHAFLSRGERMTRKRIVNFVARQHWWTVEQFLLGLTKGKPGDLLDKLKKYGSIGEKARTMLAASLEYYEISPEDVMRASVKEDALQSEILPP